MFGTGTNSVVLVPSGLVSTNPVITERGEGRSSRGGQRSRGGWGEEDLDMMQRLPQVLSWGWFTLGTWQCQRRLSGLQERPVAIWWVEAENANNKHPKLMGAPPPPGQRVTLPEDRSAEAEKT